MARDTEDKIIVKSEGCTFRWFACVYVFSFLNLKISNFSLKANQTKMMWDG